VGISGLYVARADRGLLKKEEGYTFGEGAEEGYGGPDSNFSPSFHGAVKIAE
jgi:hypothetical protein